MCISLRYFRWTFLNSAVFRRPKVIILLLILGAVMLFLRIKEREIGDLGSRFRLMNILKDESAIRSSLDFNNFNNDTGIPGVYIVPNVIHFIRFGERNMTFIEAACVFAALKNQRPDKLIIHTDRLQQGGKYWEFVTNNHLAVGVLEVKLRRPPTSILKDKFNKKHKLFHASEVARLEVLMEEGGIYLDGDSYIVRSLDEFRKFEMTLGWQEHVANQVIIAHKHARFLKEWHETYYKDYWGSEKVYNARDKPTLILDEKPYLIHRVKSLLAEQTPHNKIMSMIYLEKNKKWMEHYAIHLGERRQIIKYNDKNIRNYHSNLRNMVMDVYPFPENSTPSS